MPSVGRVASKSVRERLLKAVRSCSSSSKDGVDEQDDVKSVDSMSFSMASLLALWKEHITSTSWCV